MEPTKKLSAAVRKLVDGGECVFAVSDLVETVPDRHQLVMMLSRLVKDGVLKRVCNAVFFQPVPGFPRDRVLCRTAAKLRPDRFNYISLETALSDAGMTRQRTGGWVTIISSGGSNVVDCGEFGQIEFTHTRRKQESIAAELTFDEECRLWRASVRQAMLDMRASKRNMDLVDMDLVNAELKTAEPEPTKVKKARRGRPPKVKQQAD